MGPVSIGTLASLFNKCVSAINALHKSHEEYARTSEKIESTKRLLRDLNTAMEKVCATTNYDDKVANNWMVDHEKIKRKIEDSMDNFYYDTNFPGNKRDVEGWLARVYFGTKVVLMNPAAKALFEDINKIDELVKEVTRNKSLLLHAPINVDPNSGTNNKDDDEYGKVNKPVGIETPRDGLVQLLKKEDTEKIVVIAIYGPGGSGKSVLAKAVYEEVEKEFDFKAQFTASSCEASKLLEDIIKGFGFNLPQAGCNPDSHLKKQLQASKDKRYIVKIDDIPDKGYWNLLKDAFPDDMGSVRLIVTTRTEDVAKHCSKSCQPYEMQRLDKKAATHLLEEKAFENGVRPDTSQKQSYENVLTVVLESCEYHPVAIADMGKYLDGVFQWWELEKKNWDFGENINKFKHMKNLFNCSYRRLDYTTKTCLFSLLSTCPNGEEDGSINRKSVITRWLAERLINEEPVMEKANERFRDLVNHNFIIPMELSFSAKEKVKTFRVNRMMLPFIRAIPWNSGSWLDIDPEKKVKPNPDTVQLCLHNSNIVNSMAIDLSGIRLLKFHGMATNAPMKFESTKFLRVLVLENIENLKEEDIGAFCCPSLLKYLSIRGSYCVSRLPENIVELQLLETLDTRGTGVDEIPMDVVLLPELIHLLGEFKITSGNKKSKMQRARNKVEAYVPEGSKRETGLNAAFPRKRIIQPKDSKLQTLGGLVIHSGKSSDIFTSLPQMPRLSKVKILCGRKEAQTAACPPSSVSSHQSYGAYFNAKINSVSKKAKGLLTGASTSQSSPTAESSSGHNALVDSLKSCLEKNVRFHSLSIDFSCCDDSSCDLDFLDELKIDGKSPILQSLKLNGKLTKLPVFILSLSGSLEKLYLLGTNLAWGSVLLELGKLKRLQFLKLREDALKPEEKELNFQKSCFGGLQRLCFEVETVPNIVVEDGAMKGLQSLQLRCKQWGDISGIRYLRHIEELIISNNSNAVDVLPQIREQEAKNAYC